MRSIISGGMRIPMCVPSIVSRVQRVRPWTGKPIDLPITQIRRKPKSRCFSPHLRLGIEKVGEAYMNPSFIRKPAIFWLMSTVMRRLVFVGRSKTLRPLEVRQQCLPCPVRTAVVQVAPIIVLMLQSARLRKGLVTDLYQLGGVRTKIMLLT